MAISEKIQKVILITSLIAVVLGANSSSRKLSSSLLLLGFTSSSFYCLTAPKPWVVAKSRRRRYREFFSLLHQYRDRTLYLESQINFSDSVEELRGKIAHLEVQRNQLESDCTQLEQLAEELKLESQAKAEGKYQTTLSQLEEEKRQLLSEVSELKKLADEITSNTERDARLEAAKIKQAAQEQAQKIIKATETNLQNTVYGPKEKSHLLLLQEIDEKRQTATAELERVMGLQEKTRLAIEKMKHQAQQEYARIKERITKKAKEQYLRDIEKFNQIIEEQQNQLKLLATQNQMMQLEIESYDEPTYPEGYREDEVYARGIIDFYKSLGIKLDHKNCWKDGNRVVVRVIPRDEKIGENQLRRYHDRLQRKFDLSELPTIVTTSGCIQFELKLIELQTPVVELIQSLHSPHSPVPLSPSLPIHPELVSHEEMRSHLGQYKQKQFVPPEHRFSPFEPLCETERDWVVWLWNCCKITDQNTIMGIVWKNTRGRGVSQGVGQSYIRAREKLHRIMDEAGIPRRRKNDFP
jgi:F0F1-type ATP synthase membrane subunit b/b'